MLCGQWLSLSANFTVMKIHMQTCSRPGMYSIVSKHLHMIIYSRKITSNHVTGML